MPHNICKINGLVVTDSSSPVLRDPQNDRKLSFRSATKYVPSLSQSGRLTHAIT